MTEPDRDEPPILRNIADDQEEVQDVAQNPLDQSMMRLESDIKEQMTSMATEVRDSIVGLSDIMQRKFLEFETKMDQIESKIREQNNWQLNSTNSLSNANSNNFNLVQSQAPQSADNSSSTLNQTSEIPPQGSSNLTLGSKGDNHIKLKPQTFSGTDDFEDFLAQFEITAEINGWDYRAKSLYLANSLTGTARSLLNEVTSEERRDYKSLVQKLTARYGSENRAEVYRSQLKSRCKGKGETIPELAQAIKKLTRQSYPNANLDVIEALSLDYFIDALSESEIRLRLREVGPKTLSEAEKIAVRMEAHRIADKQRTRLVGKVEFESPPAQTSQKNLENHISDLNKNVGSLQKTMQNLISSQNNQQNRKTNGNYYQGSQDSGNRSQAYNRGWNAQYRGDNPRQNNHQNYQAPSNNQNQPNRQGNFRQSNQGSGFRLRQKGPRW